MTKPLPLRRTHIVKVRFNRSEKDQLITLAKGTQLALFARNALLNKPFEVTRRTASRVTHSSRANSQAVRHLAMIGNNLNQIARALNAHLKNHPEQNFSVLVIAHLLHITWKRLDATQGL